MESVIFTFTSPEDGLEHLVVLVPYREDLVGSVEYARSLRVLGGLLIGAWYPVSGFVGGPEASIPAGGARGPEAAGEDYRSAFRQYGSVGGAKSLLRELAPAWIRQGPMDLVGVRAAFQGPDSLRAWSSRRYDSNERLPRSMGPTMHRRRS